MASSSKSTSKKDIQQLDENGMRRSNRRSNEVPVKKEGRKKQRRRLIDPTTCERDYSQQEIEFMQAMDEYKRSSGRMFPTCSEILEVLRGMGYRRLSADQLAIEVETDQDALGESLESEDSFEEECSF